MLEKVRKHLRIKSTNLDEEIKDLIQACLEDLKIAGVEVPSYADDVASYGNSTIDRCIILYCKAHFGLQVDEKMQACYFHTKNTLVIGGAALRE